MKSSIRNEIKAQIIRAGYTMQEVVDQLHDEYGWKMCIRDSSQKNHNRDCEYRNIFLHWLPPVFVYEMCIRDSFDCVYNIINDEEKRNVVTALIKEIEIYRNDESEYPLKRIGLIFPVFKDGGEVTELLWDKGNPVECVALIERK